jgi:hypothetical protein
MLISASHLRSSNSIRTHLATFSETKPARPSFFDSSGGEEEKEEDEKKHIS